MAPRTIVLRGDPLRKERTANGTITPGMLIELVATTGKVVVHDTAGGDAAPMFAVEDDLQGNEIGDDYSAGQRAQYVTARPGDEVYAWLADGESAAIGSFLESKGDGTLRVFTPATIGVSEGFTNYGRNVVAQALETLDLSASANEVNGRIIVEVL